MDPQLDFLQSSFTRGEIKRVISDRSSTKAPGPDGFSFRFLNMYWNQVADDIEACVIHFFHYSSILKGFKAYLFMIISKIGDRKTTNDFILFSLIECQYKINGKLLANRSREVIHNIVNFGQAAFVKGR